MNSDNSSEENLMHRTLEKASLFLKESMQLFCLCAILSTYLFVILSPNAAQDNKAFGGKY
jgi:hypothetical protein